MSSKSDSESQKKENAKEHAKAAFEVRSKRSSDAIYYWMVIGGFCVMCLACVYYVFREWRESPNLILAVNPIDIEAHNSRHNIPFLRGTNELFKV